MVVPDVVKVVKAPVDAVVAPIGVLLIDVAVVAPKVVVLDEDKVVNEPVDPLIVVLVILPPVIVAEFVVKEVTLVDPAYRAPPIPTPPAITRAPVEVDVEGVDENT